MPKPAPFNAAFESSLQGVGRGHPAAWREGRRGGGAWGGLHRGVEGGGAWLPAV